MQPEEAQGKFCSWTCWGRRTRRSYKSPSTADFLAVGTLPGSSALPCLASFFLLACSTHPGFRFSPVTNVQPRSDARSESFSQPLKVALPIGSTLDTERCIGGI